MLNRLCQHFSLDDTALHIMVRCLWRGLGIVLRKPWKGAGLIHRSLPIHGRAGDEMHRAIRLVVDVALHTKNMTREQAIAYMMDNEAISEQGATAEIERYMAMPGQALSYKIGALKIRELREKYAKQLGAKFSLAAFHDELLYFGCMPLELVEMSMDTWAKGLK